MCGSCSSGILQTSLGWWVSDYIRQRSLPPCIRTQNHCGIPVLAASDDSKSGCALAIKI